MAKIRRIPKNYRGVKPTGRMMSDLMPRVLCEIQEKSKGDQEIVFRTWIEVVGERLAPMTEPQGFTNGVLFVKVKNATLHSILSGPEKKRLIDEMRKKLPGVTMNTIVFKI